ncbi:MAG: PH domain-containing protein [Gammaproteobacteria bacterium]|nr:PH domain-containing protein [Gammaproteobacteria bacterium]
MKPNIQLHEGESILIETQPKQAIVWYWITIRALTWVATLFIILLFSMAQFKEALGFLSFLRTNPLPYLGVIAIIIAVIAALIVTLVYVWLSAVSKKHWYFITNERCINFSGFYGINKQIILFANIVDVNVRQNPLEHFLGISSVIIDVPSLMLSRRRSRGSLAIIGLTPEDAEKISHLIGEKMS